MIFAGLETPAAATTPPSSRPVCWIQVRVPWTAVAMLALEETSVGKKRARAGGRSWTRESPLGALRSRMEMLAPAEMRVWTVARPRPEALGEEKG